VPDKTFDQLLCEARLLVFDIRRRVAARRVQQALKRLAVLAHKAGFNPAQLRVPAGNPDGGQWTGGGGAVGGLVHQVGARGRQFGVVRVGRASLPATPGQTMRLANATAWARSATERVRELDPTWRPRPSFTETVEGEIRAREMEAREAQQRLAELTRARFGDNQGPPLDPLPPRPGRSLFPPTTTEVISAYRTITGMPDETGGRSSNGTIAFALVDGQPAAIGVNSDAPGYVVRDEVLAMEMRTRLIERYPDVMATNNIGQKPNDALFHAEASALLRAAEPFGGTLAGRTIEMRVDRELCRSCQRVLASIGAELGNPSVRIIDGIGDIWIMRDGTWIRRGRP